MNESKKSGLDRLYDRIKTHGIESLTDAERQMFAVHWLFVEGYNGGLHQFLFNNAGMFAESALDGLQAVGARETADIIRRAIAIFPNSRVPYDQSERRAVMCNFSEQQDQVLNELTTEFFRRTDGDENISKLILDYIESNPDLFPILLERIA